MDHFGQNFESLIVCFHFVFVINKKFKIYEFKETFIFF